MTPAKRGYLHGLDLLRVLASAAVVYTHIAGWFDSRGREWDVSTFVDRALIKPLLLNPNLSFLGVGTFLVVSGLVVTLVTTKESPAQFLRRRSIRLFPLLVAVSVVGWLLINAGLYIPSGKQESMGVLDLLAGASLVGFFTTPNIVVIDPAWTLVVQLFFFAFIAACIPLLRRKPWVPLALAAALVSVGLSLTTDEENLALRRLGVIAAYFPVLCIGATIALVYGRRLRPLTGWALGAVHFGLFVWAARLGGHIYTGTAHPRTLALVTLLVILTMTAADRVTTARVTTEWSARTYAIYLVHPFCLYPLLDGLAPVVGIPLALLIALVALAVASDLAYRFVERPVARLLRRRKGPSRPEAGDREDQRATVVR